MTSSTLTSAVTGANTPRTAMFIPQLPKNVALPDRARAGLVKMPLSVLHNITSNVSAHTTVMPPPVSRYQRLFPMLLVYYAIIVLVISVVSNLLAFAACLLTYRRNPSVMLGYLASLSVADLLFSFLASFDSTTHFSLTSSWACKLEGFLTETCYTSTILILVAISYERMRVVATPILARMRRFRFRRWLPVLVWLIASFICSPFLLFYTRTRDGACTKNLLGNLVRLVYYGLQTHALFYAALAFMIWAHVKIFKTLVRHSTFRRGSSTTAAIFRSEEKLTRMLVTVVVVFCVCHIPFMAFRLMVSFGLDKKTVLWQTSWRIARLLVFTQSCVNPFIYCFFSKQFRKACRDVLTCRCRAVRVANKRGRIVSLGTSLELRAVNYEGRGGAHEQDVTVL